MILRGPARPDLLRDECLGDILSMTAGRAPEHPALIDGERVVSYGELLASARRLAQSLASRGIGPGQIVGLWLPRGADLLIAQAGIALANAAWLPFDAETPRNRVEECLQASGAKGLVTCRAWKDQCAGLAPPVWLAEDLWSTSEDNSLAMERPRPDDPAYVIYTSGSTGRPKGIAVSQRSICHFLRSENEVLAVRADDRVFQGFSLAFDMSFEEIWIAYLVGATLWIAPHDVVRDPDRVAAALTRQQLTVLHAVPTLMGLIDHPLPTVRLINLGGEACPEALARRLARPGRELFNTYGPTETTVTATLERIQPERPVTIGTPLPNYGLLVLDEQRRPRDDLEVGELAIFGPGVALGYLGQPALTAERFIPNPRATTPDESRLYLTGDLGRINARGSVEYLGRADGQVKIRGFRVELGEIETVAAEQPCVAAAAVTLRSIADIEQLVAFVVPLATEPDAAALRRALGQRLPPYMVPAHVEFVTQLPRLASGKVDRRALRELPLSKPAHNDQPTPSPLDEDATALRVELGTLFPGAAMPPDADFFADLGGHSLLVARLVSRLRAHPLYASLCLQDVYQNPRLDALAATLRRHRERHQPAATRPRAQVSVHRRWLCGLVQAATIPLLMVLHIADWLAPFFTYHHFTGDADDSVPVAVVYSLSTFVLAEVATFGVAIAGKWLIAGRLRAGRYPLWGVTYYRWWLAATLGRLPPLPLLSGTPLLVWYLRALGARIGHNVQIDSVAVAAPDLLTIAEGASVGTAVQIENAWVDRGELVIGPVRLGRDSCVDSYAVLEHETTVGDGARLNGLSALAAGQQVPDGETWEGAPARRASSDAEALPPRPRVARLFRVARLAFFSAATLAVAVLFFLPVFPSFMVIDWLDAQFLDVFESNLHPLVAFWVFFALSIPASGVLVLATTLLAAGLRRVFLPRQLAGRFAVHGVTYCRKWLLTRILDSSLGVLHGLYASLFAASWLRLMGARVGRGAEISTAVGIVPDLLRLGDYSFIADGAMLGDKEVRGGWMVLRPTALGNRSFVGNGAYVAGGALVPDDVLIGVQTHTPDNDQLRPGQTWMGSPPMLVFARESLLGFPDSLTFHPSRFRWLGRAFVEALRIVLPLAFVIASGYLIVHLALPFAVEEDWLLLTLALAVCGVIYGLASFLLVIVLKWTLIGRYRPRAAPMWTPFVWLSEAVTNIYESLAVPNLMQFLQGTPWLPWALRLLGARLGRGIYLGTTDLTEFDCVTIGDDAELNAGCGPQTHLFEDRVMKIGRVEIGARVTVGSGSTILYETRIGDDVQLGPLTLVAKGERMPPGTCWEGSPAVPVSSNTGGAVGDVRS